MQVEARHLARIPIIHDVAIDPLPALAPFCPPHFRAHESVSDRRYRRTTPHPPAELGGYVGRAVARAQAPRPLDVGCQIAVAEPDPRFAAQPAERLHERPGFVPPAPSGF